MWHRPLLLRLCRVGLLVAGVLLAGTFGYVLLEGWSPLEGFYMTVITLSTVGYGETRELSWIGRCFTAFLICGCVVTMTIWSAVFTSFIVEGDLRGHFLRRRMLRMAAKLRQHTVVCGAGMMGQAVIEKLMARNEPVVVIDRDDQVLEQIRRRFPRVVTICGSATNELTLAQANVLHAKNVVATLTSDVDNLLVAITCLDMGNHLRVYARSNDPTIANRMRKAGVHEVISPSKLGGDKVAELILS